VLSLLELTYGAMHCLCGFFPFQKHPWSQRQGHSQVCRLQVVVGEENPIWLMSAFFQILSFLRTYNAVQALHPKWEFEVRQS